MRDLRTRSEFHVLLLPYTQQFFDLVVLKFAQTNVVLRAVAHNARDSLRGPVQINAGRWLKHRRCIKRHARMIVIENKHIRVRRIDLAMHSRIARTQVTIFHVIR